MQTTRAARTNRPSASSGQAGIPFGGLKAGGMTTGEELQEMPLAKGVVQREELERTKDLVRSSARYAGGSDEWEGRQRFPSFS